MNVLVLMVDQHRADVLGCAGHPVVQTPNIDRLAESGHLYTNAYCASPLCGPSRAAFLTGRYPNSNGNVTHSNGRYRTGERYEATFHDDVQFLPAQFRQHGYQTFGTGYLGVNAMQHGRHVTHRDVGFDNYQTENYPPHVPEAVQRQYGTNGIDGEMWEPDYFNVDGMAWPFDESQLFDRIVANQMCSFLQGHDTSRPFFAYVGFRAVHPPWVPPQRFLDLYSMDNIGEPPNYTVQYQNKPRRIMERLRYFDCRHYSEDMVRRSIAAYFGYVSFIDDCVGQVLDCLERFGLADETLVVYTSDHGENLYQHGICEKHTLFESSVRIPLIVRCPGQKDERCEQLVENVDILPSIMRTVGLAPPDACNDADLGTGKPHVFSEYYHTSDPCRMLRRGRHKYIHTVDDINELYDLENDPDEAHNLAWSPDHAELVAELDALVCRDWQVPELPPYAPWNDLMERKQRQLLAGRVTYNFHRRS